MRQLVVVDSRVWGEKGGGGKVRGRVTVVEPQTCS